MSRFSASSGRICSKLFTMFDPLDVIDGPYLMIDGIEESPEPIDHR